MKQKGIVQWLRKNYLRVIHSIAFYPVIITVGFLFLSLLTLELDFSETGRHIKSTYGWMRLQDPSTARTILATIAGGIISLTVFSFSMVMIVLNQAASQMSNRTLDSMIGNRFQQVVLGFYIGSIVYALFLLSTIRELKSGMDIPALGVYFAVLLTVVNIFLFIYFIHYVTQSVKFNTIISRTHNETRHSLDLLCTLKEVEAFTEPEMKQRSVGMPYSDYFQGFNKEALLKFTQHHNLVVKFLYPAGTYLLKDTPVLTLYYEQMPTHEVVQDLILLLDIFNGHPIENNPYYGYHQLAEVAIKALSPGINDPQTAVLSLHALTDLLSHQLNDYMPLVYVDEQDTQRIATVTWTFEKLFTECFYAIWDYGKNDRYVQAAMEQMIGQLRLHDHTGKHAHVLLKFRDHMQVSAGQAEG